MIPNYNASDNWFPKGDYETFYYAMAICSC